ncbi:18815_t:CDS:2, partial [Racocetra persica]
LTEIIVTDIISAKDIGRYQSILNVYYSISSIIGPFLGGVFTDHITWRNNITFYALDLMENELNKSLSSLGTFSHVKLVGLCATYEDGMDFIATLPDNKQKTFMWLGSSIGDLSREMEQTLSSFPRKRQGINAEFAMNALDHLNVIFDQPFINRNNFQPIMKMKVDVNDIIVSDDINKEKIKINVKEDVLILIAYSYKYNKAEITKLFYDAHLAHVGSWSDSDFLYDLHLIYKPPFFFTRPQELKGSVPTISIFEYQDKVRQRLLRIYDAYKDKQIPRSLVQFKGLLPPKGVVIPNLRQPIHKASGAKLLTIQTQTITLGHDDNEDLDDSVETFKIQSRPITNNEYLEFMKVTVNQNYPLSWILIDLSSFEYRVRTVAMNWPVLIGLYCCVLNKQAIMLNGRRITMFYDTYSRNLNSDLPIGIQLMSRSAWACPSTKFEEYPGFVKSKLYPGNSSDLFDGKHYVILGGS